MPRPDFIQAPTNPVSAQFAQINRDLAPAEVAASVRWLRDAITDLSRLRLDPYSAAIIAEHEADLLFSLAGLQFLCSDIRLGKQRS